MKIIVTGGAGFIGANFVPYFIENNSDYHVVNLDLLTYAGNLENVSEVENHPRYTFVQGDICDRNFVEELFQKYQFHDVIHFAAESHVDNSISGPEAFIKTNVLGTFNLLDTARKLWMLVPNQYNAEFQNSRFHHVSTDEVYGTLGETGLFEETTPYAPNSPYSASKAGIIGLTKSVAKELAGRGVTANAVAPGYIATDMTSVLPDKVKDAMKAQIPAKRIGTPDDVADVVAFLCSDDAAYVTGEVIRVDGGLAM